ncbi:DUF4331 domain-containing protein [Nonlabens sp. Ci31]|jgi:hypothetical protein|uniref:DUF4331 family protein n=1 Tax=Nonlabens sp. Ci31 TaxID=2608253 RepID=UPI0014643A06|nr:DUF4331 family protein [Nonlabens sp. Ci31]QJP35613.1 DUF4331 domain-containing protein [Nonlabens sp. Ci31]
MKKIALWSTLAIAAIAGSLIAADHLDAPNVRNMNTDIADFFAFEGENSTSTTFIVSLPAGSAASNFDENVMIEINIDNTGADVPGAFPASVGVSEDLVIQALRQGDKMYFFGPYAPNSTTLSSTIDTNEAIGSVTIGSPGELLTGGIHAFAGQRQDAFFFDFQQFNTVAGTAPAEGFGSTGTNAFSGANVNAIVLEVPNVLLGTAPTHLADQFRAGLGAPVYGLPNSYNVWVETKRRN